MSKVPELRVTNFLNELRWNPYHDSFFLLQSASLSYFKTRIHEFSEQGAHLWKYFYIKSMSSIVKIFLQLLEIDHSLSDDGVIVCRFVTTYFVDHL
jgi:hypothetical protein